MNSTDHLAQHAYLMKMTLAQHLYQNEKCKMRNHVVSHNTWPHEGKSGSGDNGLRCVLNLKLCDEVEVFVTFSNFFIDLGDFGRDYLFGTKLW